MSNIFDLFKKIETKSDAGASSVTFIIAGLGNIGKQYEKTRHNAGFLAIDHIAEKCGAKIDRVKFHSTVCEVNLGGARVLLMKPTTLMNNSGVAIGEAAAFYKISPERVLVLHDEISFDPGIIRIRRKGSAGGHNGLKSIIAHLGTEEFQRVKIGVGAKPAGWDLADYVLGRFDDSDRKLADEGVENAAKAVECMLEEGIQTAMNKYNILKRVQQ